MKNINIILILILLASLNLFGQISLYDLPPLPRGTKLQITNLIYSLNYLQSFNKIKEGNLQQGNDLIIGDDDPNETITITGNYLLSGNLIIINNGRLILDSANFQIDGDIQISDTGELNATGGTFEIIENFIYEHRAIVMGSGVLNLDGVQFHSSGQSWEVSVIGNGKYNLLNSEISDGFITTAMFEQGEAQIINNQLPGEFLCFGENNLEFRNNDWLLFWLVLFDTSTVDISLPGDSLLNGWLFNNNQPGVQGIPYSVLIDSCTNVNWGLISRSGSDATFTGSHLRTIGLMFLDPDSITVQNITNNSTHIDDIINIPDRNLHLVNSNVDTWSFYPAAHSNITVKNCIFGEMLTMDTANAAIDNSICDGTGGYLGASGLSTLIVSRSIINTQVITKDFAVLAGVYSAFMGQQIVSNNFSILAVLNTQFLSELTPNQASIIFNEQLPTVEGIAGENILIDGTAQMLIGPESTIEYQGYQVFYSSDPSNPDWHEIDGLHLNQVVNDTLAVWNTEGLQPGSYPLALAVYHSLGDSIPLLSNARLLINTPVDDENLIVYTFKLEQNYPNPFNPATKIRFTIAPSNLPEGEAFVILKVYDVLGNEVETLVNEEKPAGEYEVAFTASGLSSGIYFYKLTAGRFSSVKKMLLVK